LFGVFEIEGLMKRDHGYCVCGHHRDQHSRGARCKGKKCLCKRFEFDDGPRDLEAQMKRFMDWLLSSFVKFLKQQDEGAKTVDGTHFP
jgi:hypothetical protein